MIFMNEGLLYKVAGGWWLVMASCYKPKQRMLGPAATATYCLPFTLKVIGEAFIRTLVGKCQSVLPERASTASKPPLGLP